MKKNPLAKLEGKIQLLNSRMQLTDKILKDRQYNLMTFWEGTALISCIELAFLLSQNNPNITLKDRYHSFLKYIRLPEIQKIIGRFKITKKASPFVVPFYFLKWKWYRALFISCWFMQKLNFRFDRK